MGRRSTDPALPNCLRCGAPNKRKTIGTKYCSRTCAGHNSEFVVTRVVEFAVVEQTVALEQGAQLSRIP
jgi:hypothetical protein